MKTARDTSFDYNIYEDNTNSQNSESIEENSNNTSDNNPDSQLENNDNGNESDNQNTDDDSDILPRYNELFTPLKP